MLNIKFKKENKPFLLLFIVAMIVHLFLPLNWGDDAIFDCESNKGLIDFLSGSSRILTDSMTYIFSCYHILWRLINPLVLVLLSVVLSKLITCENEYFKNSMLCILIVYPTMVIVDAGFIATTVNYLWPVTFGLCSLIPIKLIYSGKRVKWYVWLVCLPLLIYALNMEQMCVMLAAVIFISIIYLIKNKKLHPCIAIEFLICIGGLVYSYISNTSGDGSRMNREIARYFPNFASLSLLNKFELGFSSTFYCMTMKFGFASIAFLSFSLFLGITIMKKYKNISKHIISMFPFIFSLFMSLASLIPDKYVPFLKYLTGGMKHYKMTKATYSFEIIPDFIFVLILIFCLYSIKLLIEDRKILLTTYIILILGFGSRMIMGFSPTVWASGYRTFCILFISMIISTIIIINQNITNFNKSQKSNDTHSEKEVVNV